ncbi:MAG: ABC transporter substrate-binding protein [Burkholderiaceae bacterium]
MNRVWKSLRALACGLAALAASASARAEDIVVTHYGSLLYGLPYAIALDKGWFKEAGVDVKGILTSKGGGTSVRNMMAGDTLFAEVALPAALAAIREGFDIRIVSGGTDGSSSFWVTRPGEPIDKPEDLRGKRFVYSRPKSVSEATTLALLDTFKLKASDVKMVAIGDFGAGLTALEHKQVDLAIIPEPIYSQHMKEGRKYKLMPWFEGRLPAYTQTVGIATGETIAKRGDKLRALLEARRRGVEFLYANPKEAAAILAKAYNLAPDVAASAIANTLKISPQWWNRGALEYPLMNAMADALGAVGAITLPVDWKAATDERFIPAAARRK